MKKTLNIIKLLTNLFSTRINDEEAKIPHELRSYDYEKKLALIVKNTDKVDNQDLKYVLTTNLSAKEKSDLFSAYRLDFHTKDQLKKFKKKYKSLLL